jgi:hypothetical protein
LYFCFWRKVSTFAQDDFKLKILLSPPHLLHHHTLLLPFF